MSNDFINIEKKTFFWDQPLPEGLMTEDGFEATFSKSRGNTQSNINYKQCKFAVEIQYSDGSTTEEDLGVFLIQDITTDANGESATMNLTSLVQPLQDTDADIVKDGMSWYQNRPTGFLIKELLKTTYIDVDGVLPENTIIKTRRNKTWNDEYTLSAFGNPPEYDGRNFLSLGLTCRALTSGNIGRGNRLYLGCDNQLWEYNPETDIYCKIGTLTVSTNYIKRLWLNETVTPNVIWGIAYPNLPQIESTNLFQLTETITIFKVSLIGGIEVVQEVKKCWSGEWTYRRPVVENASNIGIAPPYYSLCFTGMEHTYTGEDHGENLAIPFKGSLTVGYHRARSPAGAVGIEIVASDGLRSLNKLRTNLVNYANPSSDTVLPIPAVDNRVSASDWLADGPGYFKLQSVGTSNSLSFLRQAWSVVRIPNGSDGCFDYLTKFKSNRFAILFLVIQDHVDIDEYGRLDLTKCTEGDNPLGWYYPPELRYDLKAYDTVTNTFTTVKSDLTIDSPGLAGPTPLMPSILFTNKDAYGTENEFDVHVGGVIWLEHLQEYSRIGLSSYKLLANGTYNLAYFRETAGNTEDAWTPISGVYNKDMPNREIIISICDRTKLLTQNAYSVVTLSKGSPYIYPSYSLVPSNQFLPWRQLANMDGKTYTTREGDKYQNGGNAQLWCMSYLGNTTFTWMPLDNMRPPVTNESNQLSNLVTINDWELNYPVLYGTSAGYYPIEMQDQTIVGGISYIISSKNYLWKYDKYISDRIELADYNGLKVWDALVLHANASRSYVGFDLDSFIFVPKRYEEEAILTFDADYDTFISLSKKQDREIRNVVKATPYSASLGDMKYNITLRTGHAEYWKGDLNLVQKNVRTQRIRMRCVKPGSIASADTSTLRFAYLVHSDVMEAKLSRDLDPTDVYVYLPTVYGEIKVGDYIVITDPVTKIEKVIRIIGIDVVKSRVQIESSGLSSSVKAYTPIKIISTGAPSQGSVNSIFSDEGVAIVKSVTPFKISNISYIGIGTIITIGSSITEYTVNDINPIPDTTGWTLTLNTTPTGIAVNDLIRAYFKPHQDKSFRLIGNSGIEIAFLPSTPSNPDISKFGADAGGDIIEIEVPGLSLQGDENSKYSSIDVESVRLYGKREYSIPDNRFIHHSVAADWVRREVEEAAHPKLLIDLSVCLSGRSAGETSIGFVRVPFVNAASKKLSKIKIIHKGLFKMWAGYAIEGYLTAQSFSPKGFTQKFTIRSSTPF